MSIEASRKTGYRIGIISTIANVVLFVFKLLAAYQDNSAAIEADAWHTLSDSLSSLVIIFGFIFMSRPRNKKYPYGYGRIELFCSIVIGLMLISVGSGFIFDGVDSFFSSESPITSYSLFAYIVTIITIISKEILAQVSIRIGRKHNYKSLVADGWHHRSDAISSLVILIGLFTAGLFPWIDSVLCILVALLIIHTAVEVLKDSIRSLLGRNLDDHELERVRNCSKKVDSPIKDLHHFHLHEYGEHAELTFHGRLPETTILYDAHKAADVLEKELKQELGWNVTIHVECSA